MRWEAIRIDAEGLTLHALERRGAGAKVLLLHGFQDHAHSFDRVAEHLPEAWHLLSLDFRGHGRSAHVPVGAHYHFTDFVSDLHAARLHLGGAVHLVGHSMGGSIALLYAAAAPDHVRSVFSIESLGPIGGSTERWLEKLRGYVADLGKPRRRRVYATIDEAIARVREASPLLPPDVAEHMTRHAVAEVEGGFAFTFDPMLRRSFGHSYAEEQIRVLLREVNVPVRVLRGSAGFAWADDHVRARLGLLRAGDPLVVEGGHHVHLERPAEVARAIETFVSSCP